MPDVWCTRYVEYHLCIQFVLMNIILYVLWTYWFKFKNYNMLKEKYWFIKTSSNFHFTVCQKISCPFLIHWSLLKGSLFLRINRHLNWKQQIFHPILHETLNSLHALHIHLSRKVFGSPESYISISIIIIVCISIC